MQVHTPRRLTAVTRSKCSAGSSGASLGGIMIPALLNAMSRLPSSLTVRSTRAATCFSSETSQGTPSACRPVGSLLVGGGTQRLLVGVGEDDGGAGLGEGPSGGETYSGAGAGDDGDLAVEVVGRVHASPLVIEVVERAAWLHAPSKHVGPGALWWLGLGRRLTRPYLSLRARRG